MGKARQKKVKVHQTGVRLPAIDDASCAAVIQWPSESEPESQPVTRANVVAWKHAGSTEAPEQNILGSPSPNSVQPQEHLSDSRIVQVLQLLEIRLA